MTKGTGKEVIGGSINLFGSLVVRVTHSVSDGVVAHIIEAVEDAQTHKRRVQRFADRLVAVFVPIILLLSAATVAGHLIRSLPIPEALMTGVSVLVIACPCSLGLATPLAVLMFTSVAASRGIMVRSGEILESLPQITDVVFDKTGTVTLGRPVLREVISFDPSIPNETLLAIAGLLHPIVAAAAMAASSLIVVLNSLRVGRQSAPDTRTITPRPATPK